ncbi:suppressor of exocyst mutations 1 [Halictus rubicundus]|uniref:suppressor of exocyst mutations 1 n=1 Tax=Halictus rubicundus TaxID=77578 RepID=UPI0040362666
MRRLCLYVLIAFYRVQKNCVPLSFLKMTDTKNDKAKVDLGLLEEDDEFEEFHAEDWTAADEDNQDISVWEDNWDDDDVEDDFNQQLRAQLEKQKVKTEEKEN